MSPRGAARLFAVVATLAAPAAHADLVANGGFESQYPDPFPQPPPAWGATGNTGLLSADQAFPASGTFDMAFTAPANTDGGGGIPTLFQTLTTVPGQSYVLSFQLASQDGAATSSFEVMFGGLDETIYGSDIGTSTYVTETFLIDGSSITGPVTALSFIGIVDSDFGVAWNLDNVSVTEVPEPSSGVLAGAALLMTLTATRTLRGSRAWSLLPARRR